MITSNDAWNNFNVAMSISQSLDNEDPKFVTTQVVSMPTNICVPSQCKKIVLSLGENFQPPLAVAFMWDGAELYYNYFKDQHNAKKTYAFNSWKRIPLENENFMNISYVRVLHRLARNGELNDDDEKKLLMFSIIYSIWEWLYENKLFNEDNPTIYNERDCESLITFINGMSETESYKSIRSKIKNEAPCTKEEFVKAMNNFFTNKQQEENKQQNNKNLNINYGTNNSNYGYDNDEKNKINNNGYCDKCITGLEDCWNYVKSCFGGE